MRNQKIMLLINIVILYLTLGFASAIELNSPKSTSRYDYGLQAVYNDHILVMNPSVGSIKLLINENTVISGRNQENISREELVRILNKMKVAGFLNIPVSIIIKPSSSSLKEAQMISVKTDEMDAAYRHLTINLQRLLKGAGFDPGPIDGKESEETKAAILAFEKKKGLPLTGSISADLEDHLTNGEYYLSYFFQALKENDVPTAEHIAENVNYIDSKDKNGTTMMISASAYGQIGIVDKLISKGASLHLTDNLGRTPLHVAAVMGHSDLVEYLIAKGADINSEIKDGKTPLHYAAHQGRFQAVKTLLKHQPKLNKKDSQGNTPLYYAILRNHRDVADFLRQNNATE